MTLSASDFELLLQANRILSSKLDVKDVLQAVMELATKVVKAEASSLLLLDERRNELYFDVALGSAKESVKQIRIKVGEGIAGWVAKERQPLIVNDVNKDPRFTAKVDKSTSFKTRSLLAVPLLAKGKLIGVVEALNKEHNQQFTPQDQEAFEVFASQSAIAIENARLFSEVIREKEKLNTMFAEMSDGVVLLDSEGKVILVNAKASLFLGLSAGDAVGKSFLTDLVPAFEVSPPVKSFKHIKDKITMLELVRRKPTDFYLTTLMLRLPPAKDPSHEGFLVILRDSTEEKRGERLKRNFLSLVSHKLRTPLTVIIGYGPILLSQVENLNEMQKKAVKAICEQGENLSGLVDKLLRFTIVESDTLNKELASQPLFPLVEKAKESFEGSLESDAVQIEINESVSKIPAVLVDSGLTVDLLRNLFENGIKFNDKKNKKILISASSAKGRVTLRVEDNGVGIPAEEREKVFQKFYQIENSFTGQIPGAGLGLALCKKVAEAMDGSIHLESEVGKGTVVSVTLPC